MNVGIYGDRDLVKKADDAKAPKVREDGRRQVLLYMKEPLIKSLKGLALKEDTTAYELAEEAVEALLKARRERKPPPPGKDSKS